MARLSHGIDMKGLVPTRSSVYAVAGVGFSLIVIFYVAQHLNWALAIDRLTTANVSWLAAGLSVFAINYILRTLRFRMLLNTPQLALRRLLGVMMLYGMFNYLLPAKSGEVSYVLLSHRYLDTSFSEGTATLIAARFFDFGIIALVLPLVLIAFFDQLPSWLLGSAFAYCVIVIGSALALLRYLRKRNPSNDQNPDPGDLQSRIFQAWQRVMNALSAIDRRGQYLPLWVLTGGIWLCVYANFYCIVASLGFEPTMLQMIVISIILVPLTLLPVQGVANIGTHEAGWVAALSMFGHSIDSAVVIAVTSHVVLFIFVLVWGATGAYLLNGRDR